ncbi:MAG: nuclear transport factor 2 family protein [Hyphomicrobiales bacterium]|nr:nuclear transport factor 2 family protein [Hyphomicrobiales bacterium]
MANSTNLKNICSRAFFALALSIAFSTSSFAHEDSMITSRQKVLETLHQYSFHFDGKNLEKFIGLFKEDATWQIFPAGAKKPVVSFSNSNKLKAFVDNRFKGALADRQTRHYITNTIFLELTNDFARTQSSVLLVHKIQGSKQPIVINTGIFLDEFVKDKNGWKFSSHVAN